MMWSSTATPSNRPDNSAPASLSGSGPWALSCIPTRRRSCTAKTRTAVMRRAHQLRLSRLHLPGSSGPWPTRLLRELLTSHEPQGEEGDRRTDQGLAPQPSQCNGPCRTRPGHQRPGSEAGSTTTGPSTAPSCMPSQRASTNILFDEGDAEVQTIARPTHQSVEMARRCPSARATTLRSLAPPRFNPTPDCGSRMTGDCHVRF